RDVPATTLAQVDHRYARLHEFTLEDVAAIETRDRDIPTGAVQRRRQRHQLPLRAAAPERTDQEQDAQGPAAMRGRVAQVRHHRAGFGGRHHACSAAACARSASGAATEASSLSHWRRISLTE